MKKNYLFLLLICLLVACHQSGPSGIDITSLEKISIDEKESTEKADATFLIDTTFARMVLLELNSECLIGEVTSLYYKNNKIIVFDKQTHSVYIFNEDGSYYSKIHAVGQGPGEYSQRVDFVLATDSTIAVLCPVIKKILYYNYEGKHLYDINLYGAYGNAFYTFDNKIFHLIAGWGSMSEGRYGYFCVDAEKGIIDKQIPFTSSQDRIGQGWLLYNIVFCGEDRTLAIRSTLDIIWEITPDNVFEPCYYIDILSNKMPREIAEGNVEGALASGFSLGVTRVMEHGKYLFLIMRDYNTVIYDKEKKNAVSLSKYYEIPEWDFHVRFNDDVSFQDKYILFEEPMDISDLNLVIEYVKTLPDSRIKTKYLNALMKIEDDEMNPLICILKFKE
ncbi:MAG: 6-bladed beta-propeller [Tannerella sp.]|jgi:hypothetical protein|nr:6-bladed beta-propeller [Tannerella sp.]